MGQPRTPGGQAKAGVFRRRPADGQPDDHHSATLGVRPRDVLEAIENMVENGTAETLVIGNRPVGNNPFRLTGSSETWGVVYNRGELARASMTINLEEYT